MVAEPVHVAHWGVYVTTPEVSGDMARVVARTTIQNEGAEPAEVTVRSTVSTADGKGVAEGATTGTAAAAGKLELTTDVQVRAPQLWSPDSPTLYELATE